ncbi:MAG: TonB-dependent receptor plug domain-containing protein [Chitinophagaceae bacterium]|nr:TonB-dependent receptor plug domain-containing protein [Chitinophagaceae bacterium]MCA6457023.1 TonB-dependent receptor plug domain-containing protein [Chitinophagaceae bacterium]MCA6457788.1 TonB-dependent receptor plug domain-containing protein [Chitinophagaceae bacterium]MCA6463501.1 TonB-dependent receptor plug domain-containing protein [Chitinophagaceae bacterium]
MRSCKTIVACIALFLFIPAGAQHNALQQLDSLAGQYIRSLREHSGEKVFLQTSKLVYRVGERVHFKAFVTHSVSGKPSRLSNVLYVDLVDERDSIHDRFLLNAADFATDGSFVLPDTIGSGHYWLRAYTKLSLKDAEQPMAVQMLYVINSLLPDRYVTSVQKTSLTGSGDSVRVQFFPEGGTMVGGANTLLAIKTTDLTGNPVSAKGLLKDDRDSVVVSWQTDNRGLGKFRFFCWTWRRYQLHLQRPGLPDLRYTVPSVNLFGAQLAVIDHNGIRKLRVLLEDSIFRKDKVTYVLGISGDSLCFSGVGKGSYELVIPEYRFPGNVAHFVLFDEKKHLLSERSVYIKPDANQVQLTADKIRYSAREKVTVSFKISDSDNRPQVASFLVSVNDSSQSQTYTALKPKGMDDIMRSIFLPGEELTPEEWELKLLTEKNRYQVDLHDPSKKIIANKEDSSLFISGTVWDTRNRPVAQKIVTLFGDMKAKVFTSDTTDAEGRFCFPFTAYDDRTRFNLQVTDLSGRLFPSKMIMDTNLVFPVVLTPEKLKQRLVKEEIETVRKAMILQSRSDTLIQNRGKEWLTDVTVTGLVKKDPGYDVKKRQSLFSKIIPPEVFAKLGGNSLGNVIFRVPGIHLRNGYVTVTGGNSFAIGAATEPLLIIDGVPIPSDTSDKLPGSEPSPVLLALNRIDPSSVEFMEVLIGPEAAIYGVRGGNGVIIVNTRTRMVLSENNLANGVRNLMVKGFHVPEPFEQRDYSLKEIRNSRIPDTRSSLIFWQGDGLTDADGKATISFYTADIATSYTVTVTGITAMGARFRKQLTIARK